MIVRRSLAGFVVGIVFGIGLAVSKMANPEKVLAFLNLASDWDPSLLFVMGAATTVAFAGHRWVTNSAPLFEAKHHLPTARRIDYRLILGAILFGIGWGLAGYCPGPAITGLSGGAVEPFVFVVAMVGGSQLVRVITES